jgi:hypothetical protein
MRLLLTGRIFMTEYYAYQADKQKPETGGRRCSLNHRIDSDNMPRWPTSHKNPMASLLQKKKGESRRDSERVVTPFSGPGRQIDFFRSIRYT